MRYMHVITHLIFFTLTVNVFAIDSKLLNVPEGFILEVFAQELDQPRQMVEGDNGTILYTENGGQDNALGFEIMDLSDFSEFVDFTKDNLLEGLKATVKIVIIGILSWLTPLIGFLIKLESKGPVFFKQKRRICCKQ